MGSIFVGEVSLRSQTPLKLQLRMLRQLLIAEPKNTVMSCRLINFCLLFAFIWQVLVCATPWSQAQRQIDLPHTFAHVQELSHHHHSDRSLHVDEHGSEVVGHHHFSETSQPMGLVPPKRSVELIGPRTQRFTDASAFIGSVFLKAPLRPPQQPTA